MCNKVAFASCKRTNAHGSFELRRWEMWWHVSKFLKIPEILYFRNCGDLRLVWWFEFGFVFVWLCVWLFPINFMYIIFAKILLMLRLLFTFTTSYDYCILHAIIVCLWCIFKGWFVLATALLIGCSNRYIKMTFFCDSWPVRYFLFLEFKIAEMLCTLFILNIYSESWMRVYSKVILLIFLCCSFRGPNMCSTIIHVHKHTYQVLCNIYYGNSRDSIHCQILCIYTVEIPDGKNLQNNDEKNRNTENHNHIVCFCIH